VARTTIIFGVMLVAVGIVGYVGTAAVSVTALIPAVFGVVLAILGWLALSERYRKHAVHLAAATGLVAFLGTVRGLIELVGLISGAEVNRPAAVVSQSVVAILMAVFVGLCVKSFIDARRVRINKGHQ
jgi:hypothetical protein